MYDDLLYYADLIWNKIRSNPSLDPLDIIEGLNLNPKTKVFLQWSFV